MGDGSEWATRAVPIKDFLPLLIHGCVTGEEDLSEFEHGETDAGSFPETMRKLFGKGTRMGVGEKIST